MWRLNVHGATSTHNQPIGLLIMEMNSMRNRATSWRSSFSALNPDHQRTDQVPGQLPSPRQQLLTDFVKFEVTKRKEAKSRTFNLTVEFDKETNPAVRNAVETCLATLVSESEASKHPISTEHAVDAPTLTSRKSRALEHIGPDIEQAFDALRECGLNLHEAASLLIEHPELVKEIAEGMKTKILSPIRGTQLLLTRLNRQVTQRLFSLLSEYKLKACRDLLEKRNFDKRDLAELIKMGHHDLLNRMIGSDPELKAKLQKAREIAGKQGEPKGPTTELQSKKSTHVKNGQMLLARCVHLSVMTAPDVPLSDVIEDVIESPSSEARDRIKCLIEIAYALTTADITREERARWDAACGLVVKKQQAEPYPKTEATNDTNTAASRSELISLAALLSKADLDSDLKRNLASLLIGKMEMDVASQWQREEQIEVSIPLVEMPMKMNDKKSSADFQGLIDLIEVSYLLEDNAGLARFVPMLEDVDRFGKMPAPQDHVRAALQQCIEYLKLQGDEHMNPLLLAAQEFNSWISHFSMDRCGHEALSRFQSLLKTVPADKFPELHECAELMSSVLSGKGFPSATDLQIAVKPKGRPITELISGMSKNQKCREFLVWLGSKADLHVLWTVMDVIQFGCTDKLITLEEITLPLFGESLESCFTLESNALAACCFPLAMRAKGYQHTSFQQEIPLSWIKGRDDGILMVAASSTINSSVLREITMALNRAPDKNLISTEFYKGLATFIVRWIHLRKEIPVDVLNGIASIAIELHKASLLGKQTVEAASRLQRSAQDLLNGYIAGKRYAAIDMALGPLLIDDRLAAQELYAVSAINSLYIGHATVSELGALFRDGLANPALSFADSKLPTNLILSFFNPLLHPINPGTSQADWEQDTFMPFVKALGDYARSFFDEFIRSVNWAQFGPDHTNFFLTALRKCDLGYRG